MSTGKTKFLREARKFEIACDDPLQRMRLRMYRKFVVSMVDAANKEDRRAEFGRNELIVSLATSVGAALISAIMSVGKAGSHMEAAERLTPIVAAAMCSGAREEDERSGGHA